MTVLPVLRMLQNKAELNSRHPALSGGAQVPCGGGTGEQNIPGVGGKTPCEQQHNFCTFRKRDAVLEAYKAQAYVYYMMHVDHPSVPPRADARASPTHATNHFLGLRRRLHGARPGMLGAWLLLSLLCCASSAVAGGSYGCVGSGDAVGTGTCDGSFCDDLPSL